MRGFAFEKFQQKILFEFFHFFWKGKKNFLKQIQKLKGKKVLKNFSGKNWEIRKIWKDRQNPETLKKKNPDNFELCL